MLEIPFSLGRIGVKCREFFQAERQTMIIYYHRVLPQIKWGDPLLLQISLENFERQVRYLARTYSIISLHELIAQRTSGAFLRKRQIVLTFDDGYRDNYLYAYPILKKYHVPATIFLTTDHVTNQSLFMWEHLLYAIKYFSHPVLRIDSEQFTFPMHSYHERMTAFWTLHNYLKTLSLTHAQQVIASINDTPFQIDEEDLPLTWAQVQEMSKTAGMTFGAHTCTHPVLSALEAVEADNEIASSKTAIETHLQQEINLFAYPYGDEKHFSSATMKLLEQRHFLCGCATISGINTTACHPFALKRNVVRNWDVLTLARKIAHAFVYGVWIE